MSEPLRLAFLGCGFITRVHSRMLRSIADDVVCSYALQLWGSEHGSKRALMSRSLAGRGTDYRGGLTAR